MLDLSTIPGRFDEDRLLAAVDMIGRSAARQLEVGWDDDTDPPGDWWAAARFRGTRVFVEHHATADDAVEALLFLLLEGAQCVLCGRHATVPGARYSDGRPACEYRRVGAWWVRGCDGGHEAPTRPLNRAQRRRQAQAKDLR